MESPIEDVIPVLGIRNVDNLQKRLVHTRSQLPVDPHLI